MLIYEDPNEITLPASTTVLPRYQKVPIHRKPKTKWELFAEKKGIKRKKRSRLVYSEELKDWVPRWGKGSAKKVTESRDVIREYKDGEMIQDLFKKTEQEKKLALKKQQLNQFKNELRDKDINPNKIIDKKIKKKEIRAPRATRKEVLKTQRKQVAMANASMGKFDPKTNIEKEKTQVRRKQKVHFQNVGEEYSRNKSLLKKMMIK